MNKKLLITAIGSGISIIANTAHSCGSVPPLGAKDKGNYLCEYCVPLEGGVAGSAAAFIKAEVNPHVVDKWRIGDSVVVTNGTKWRRFAYAPMYGTWYPQSGGDDGLGPGVPRNHNGSGTLCSKIDNNQGNNGGSGGGGYTGGSVFAPNSAGLGDYWRYYDLGMLPDPNYPTGTVWITPLSYDSYWNNYYSNLYANNTCVYC